MGPTMMVGTVCGRGLWLARSQEAQKMYWVIDRFEGDQAVCQNDAKKMQDIPRHRLPLGLKEGDVLRENGGTYRFDPVETERRRKEVSEAAKGLWG